MLENSANRNKIKIIDDTRFNTADFYCKYANELNINKNSVDEIKDLLGVLSSCGKINVRVTCVVNFAVCLNASGVNVGGVVMNEKAYDLQIAERAS